MLRLILVCVTLLSWALLEDWWWDYAMELPENGTNPCLSPAKSPGPLQRLSCMARRSQAGRYALQVLGATCVLRKNRN